jgi:hypothetical protein
VTIGGDVERFAQLVAELESALPGEAGGTGDP